MVALAVVALSEAFLTAIDAFLALDISILISFDSDVGERSF